MITPTDINGATNFIWYASLPALLLACILGIPAALLVLYKLAESAGVDKMAIWRKWRRHLLWITTLVVVLLTAYIRYDGYNQAKNAAGPVAKLLKANGWNMVGLYTIRQSINSSYDENFLLNIIHQNSETFSFTVLADKTNAAEPGLIVNDDTALSKEIDSIRTATTNQIVAGALAWHKQHLPAAARDTATRVYLPIDVIQTFVRQGNKVNRAAYVLARNSTVFRPQWQNGLITGASIHLPATR